MKRKQAGWKLLCRLLLLALTVTVGSAAEGSGGKEDTMRKSLAVMARADLEEAADYVDAGGDSIPCGSVQAGQYEGMMLTPGGMTFGVRFLTEGVTVVGFCDVETGKGRTNPAMEAGLKLKDVILQVNGKPLVGASQLTERIEHCEGRELVLLCRRGGEEIELRLKPVMGDGGYKTGIWVRDSGAGIGTVTFFLPESGAFAGLGHGICDADTGELIRMRKGTVSDVTVSAVVKGAAGAPGELKGYFKPGKVGALLGNTACGVWGIYTELPEAAQAPMPVGLRNDLQEGEAYILSTLSDNRVGRYAVEITNIHRDAAGSKCFTVKVTDPTLLQTSGGIVQGMSGSPIIQNGKIVGAVTHVLINDPTTGYGIFIENMLNAAQMPLAKAS
ncbi:MAG: SpoIVB peptidase [Ruminococcaceae bacterium]|nr:SpoIVB peptidase [Oscillospiraceae bacterium]